MGRALNTTLPKVAAITLKENELSTTQQFLLPDDLDSLHRFMEFCTDSESGGYTMAKEIMRRLAEIGVIENKGFGRYQVTTFGLYVLTLDADGTADLPLKTYREYDEDSRQKMLQLVSA